MPRPDPPVADLVADPVDVSTTGRELADGREDRKLVDRVSDLPGDPGDDHSRLATDRSHDLDHLESLQVDRSGDRSSDLGPHPNEHPNDPVEVWFEPEELAAASEVELGGATALEPQLLAHGPDPEAILAAISTPGVSLGTLPGWPDAGPQGQGLGPAAAALIGELRPGDVIVVGGRRRGVGRTSLLAQLGDGLALREGSPLTPVLFVVESSPELWRARSLARWSGSDARSFIDAGHGAELGDRAQQVASFVAGPGAILARHQRFAAAARLRGGAESKLATALNRWRRELSSEANLIWPVLVVDPLDQLVDPLVDPGAGFDGTVAALAELERFAAEAGLIVLVSCDDTSPDPLHTRRLDRHARARLRLSARSEGELELELCHRRLGPGGTVRLGWDRGSGRIEGSKKPEYSGRQ